MTSSLSMGWNIFWQVVSQNGISPFKRNNGGQKVALELTCLNISTTTRLADIWSHQIMHQTAKYTSQITKFINIYICSSMGFRGTLLGHNRGFIEFHGTLKVLCNLTPTPNSLEFHGIPKPRTKSQWNFIEFQIFHGTWLHHQIPWKSMLPKLSRDVSWNSMELWMFHGTRSDTKFHGIPWNLVIAIVSDINVLLDYRDCSINPMEIMCSQISDIAMFYGIRWNV